MLLKYVKLLHRCIGWGPYLEEYQLPWSTNMLSLQLPFRQTQNILQYRYRFRTKRWCAKLNSAVHRVLAACMWLVHICPTMECLFRKSSLKLSAKWNNVPNLKNWHINMECSNCSFYVCDLHRPSKVWCLVYLWFKIFVSGEDLYRK